MNTNSHGIHVSVLLPDTRDRQSELRSISHDALHIRAL